MNRTSTDPLFNVSFPDLGRPALFLDIDGVLNNTQYWLQLNPKFDLDCSEKFDPRSIEILNRIVMRIEPYVILSSSWRILYELEVVERKLRDQGYCGLLHGRTTRNLIIQKLEDPPNYKMSKYRDRISEGWWAHRGDEIQHWRRTFGHVGSVAIVDDDADMAGLSHRLIQTDNDTGLLEEHFEPLCQLLLQP